MKAENKTIIAWLYGFIGMAILLNLSGIGVTIIGPDGALYASIAKHMVTSGNYMDLVVEGKDWLDKPHFPFWLAALSFKVFGLSTWAYKLPALLFVLMAAFYTYKFAAALYNQVVALWAVLILLTAQHLVISTTDVRAEPYLTGLIIAAVFYFYKALGEKWFIPVLLASIFTACAVMTKGIFAVIPIAGAIAGHLCFSRQWKMLFNIRWLIAGLFILIFIMPELWALYHQFDLHPEKVVFGKQGVSGIRFFFWDSQFGRFFNTGPIKKSSGDPFFFLHTILWAFLPWAFLFYIAVVNYLRKFRDRLSAPEWYNLSAAGITVLLFSISKFQLPHYITIVFPFFAIITANYIYSLAQQGLPKAIRIMQGIVITLMVLVIVLLFLYLAPPRFSALFYLLHLSCLALLNFTYTYKKFGNYKIFFQSAVVAFLVNISFNLSYYPQLTKYQADSEAAFYINEHPYGNLPVVKVVNNYSYAIDFYLGKPLYYYQHDGTSKLPERPFLIYGDTEVLQQLEPLGFNGQLLKTFRSYRITRIKGEFLNHKTRANTLGTSQLLLIK
jgi:4-amino-4-deoxy-L-arabinose transferase-like glycosyltransferase